MSAKCPKCKWGDWPVYERNGKFKGDNIPIAIIMQEKAVCCAVVGSGQHQWPDKSVPSSPGFVTWGNLFFLLLEQINWWRYLLKTQPPPPPPSPRKSLITLLHLYHHHHTHLQQVRSHFQIPTCSGMLSPVSPSTGWASCKFTPFLQLSCASLPSLLSSREGFSSSLSFWRLL